MKHLKGGILLENPKSMRIEKGTHTGSKEKTTPESKLETEGDIMHLLLEKIERLEQSLKRPRYLVRRNRQWNRGAQRRCFYCGSTEHLPANCPHSNKISQPPAQNVNKDGN